MDSHADTCVAGSNCIQMGPRGTPVTVHAFAPGYGAKVYYICTAATVWTNPETGQDYLLVIHQCIFLGDAMRNSLLNPNQLRYNGVVVKDCPTQFDRSSSHSIHVPEHDLTIPLHLRGVISGFATRKPTLKELDDLPQVQLTRDVWNPKSNHLEEAERSAAISSLYTPDHDDVEARYAGAMTSEPSPDLYDGDMDNKENLYHRLVASVTVDPSGTLLQDCTAAALNHDADAPDTSETEHHRSEEHTSELQSRI